MNFSNLVLQKRIDPILKRKSSLMGFLPFALMAVFCTEQSLARQI